MFIHFVIANYYGVSANILKETWKTQYECRLFSARVFLQVFTVYIYISKTKLVNPRSVITIEWVNQPTNMERDYTNVGISETK